MAATLTLPKCDYFYEKTQLSFNVFIFGKGSYQKYNPHKISFLMIYYMTIFRKKYFCTYLNLTP